MHREQKQEQKKAIKKTGQTALMTHRAWPDKSTVYMQPPPLLPFPESFSHGASHPYSLPFPAFDLPPTQPMPLRGETTL